MPFQPGHPYYAGGVGRGRKKSPSRLIRDAIANDAQNLPKYFETLSEKAINGDREAAMYLIDRQLGKPKQQVDIESKGKQIGAGLVVELFQLLTKRANEIEERRYKELGEGTDMV